MISFEMRHTVRRSNGVRQLPDGECCKFLKLLLEPPPPHRIRKAEGIVTKSQLGHAALAAFFPLGDSTYSSSPPEACSRNGNRFCK